MAKSRYYIIYLLIFSIIVPLYNCFIDNSGLQMRAQKLHEYGDRLSSIEDDTGLYNYGRHSPVAPVHAKESDSVEEVNKEEDRNGEDETEEHVETNAKTLEGLHDNEDARLTTKCTTDTDIKIGTYKPESSEEGEKNKDEDEMESDKEEGGEVLKKETSDDGETATKVYIPPKRAKLPDHYVDDI